MKFQMKVTAISESADITTLIVDDLIGNLKTYEAELGELYKQRKNDDKTLAFAITHASDLTQSVNMEPVKDTTEGVSAPRFLGCRSTNGAVKIKNPTNPSYGKVLPQERI